MRGGGQPWPWCPQAVCARVCTFGCAPRYVCVLPASASVFVWRKGGGERGGGNTCDAAHENEFTCVVVGSRGLGALKRRGSLSVCVCVLYVRAYGRASPWCLCSLHARLCTIGGSRRGEGGRGRGRGDNATRNCARGHTRWLTRTLHTCAYRMVLGSVSDFVVHNCPVPVIVVRV